MALGFVVRILFFAKGMLRLAPKGMGKVGAA